MEIKPLRIIVALSILVIFSSCHGQDKIANNKAHAYAIGKNVSDLDSQIWHVFIDQAQEFWFGSNGRGLFRYDGNKLIQYTTEDGLVGNAIRGIQEDQSGNLYIETQEGVSKYDRKIFTTLEPITSENNEWKLKPEDLWFTCSGSPNDIYRYDGKSMFELKLPRENLIEAFGTKVIGLSFKGMNSSPYSVFGVDKDKAGNLWIGTIVAGAFRYDGKSFLWVAEKELTTLPDGRVPGVRSMIEDRDGYMWLSNFKSKYRVSKQDSAISYEKLVGIAESTGHFQDRIPYFNSGLSDKNGDLWMTTYTGGVWKYDGDKLVNFAVYDGEKEVLLVSIYEDNTGTIWLGTDNAGVFRYNGNDFEKFNPDVK